MDRYEADEMPTAAPDHGSNAEWLAELLDEVLPADRSEPRLEGLDRPWFRSMIALVVEVGLQRDGTTLDAAADAVRRVHAAWRVARRDVAAEQPDWSGWLLSLVELVTAVTRRIRPDVVAARIPGDSLAARFLAEIILSPGLSNRDVIDSLGVRGSAAESQVSRAGRKLVNAGLADRVRLGGENRWSVTPRGVTVHRMLHAAAAEPGPSHRGEINASPAEVEGTLSRLIASRKHSASLAERADAAYRLGVFYRRQKDLHKAFASLQEAQLLQADLDDQRSRSETLLILAQCCMEDGRFEEAVRAADDAIDALSQLQKPPNTPLAAAHLMAGRAHLASERSVAAEEKVGAISPLVEGLLASAVAAR